MGQVVEVLGSTLGAVVAPFWSFSLKIIDRMFGKPDMPGISRNLKDRTTTITDSEAPHVYVYGRARVGSAIVAALTSGTKDEYKHIVCIHAAHECDAIEEVYINGRACGTLDGSGFVTSGDYYTTRSVGVDHPQFTGTGTTLDHTPIASSIRIFYLNDSWFQYEGSYTLVGSVISALPSNTYYVTYSYSVPVPYVRVLKHLGAVDQAADTTMIAEFPNKWDATKKLSGMCYTIIRLDLTYQDFQSGCPSVEALIRGKKLHDVRDTNYPYDTPEWTDNNALVIADYLTSECCGVPWTDLPIADYIAAANVCEEYTPNVEQTTIVANQTALAAASQSLTLSASASTVADAYKQHLLRITSGAGAGQERTVVTSRKNRIAKSQEFDHALHSKSNVTVTPNTTLAPDGTLTGDNLNDTSAVAFGNIGQAAGAAVQNQPYCLSVYVDKDAIGRATRFPLLRMSFAGSVTSFVQISLDTATGESLAVSAVNGVLDGYGVIDEGTHWRVWVSGHNTDAGVTTVVYYIFPAAGSGASWVNNAATTGSIDAWGIQLEDGTYPTEYIRTEAAGAVGAAVDVAWSNNAVTRSDELDNAAWTALKSAHVTVTANDDGVAEKFTVGTWPGGGAQTIIGQQNITPASAKLTHVFEVKQGSGRYVQGCIYDTGTGGATYMCRVNFDLLNNTAVLYQQVGGIYVASGIKVLTDGYHRCWFSVSLPTSVSMGVRGMQFCDATGSPFADTTGMYHWVRHQQVAMGWQTEPPYMPTTTAAIALPDATSVYDLLIARKYTVNGSVSSDDTQADILEKLAQSMAGTITATTWGITAGKYIAPVMTLLQSDIVGNLTFNSGVSEADLFNGIKGQYINSANLYVATDFGPYENAVYQTTDGQELWKDIDFMFTNTKQRVHNLARIYTEDQRNGFTIDAEFSYKTWSLKVGDRVAFTSPFLGQTSKIYRVMGKSYGGESAVKLTLKEDAASIWDYLDAVIEDETLNTELPNPFVISPPSNLTVTEQLYETTGSAGVKNKAIITWVNTVAGIIEYEVTYKSQFNSAYNLTIRTINEYAEILDIQPGKYDFKVRARNHLNFWSDYSEPVSIEIFGLNLLPGNVTGFTVRPFNGMALCNWNRTTDLDVKIGGDVIIRFCPLTVGASFAQSIILPDGAFNGDAVNAMVSLATGTYYAQFKDSTGHYSETPASFVATESLVTGWSTVLTSTQHTTYTGVKTGCVSTDSILKLDSSSLFDSLGLLDSVSYLDSIGGLVLSGTYEFDATMDLSTVLTRRFHAHIKSLSYNAADIFDDRLTLMDTWADFDGGVINDVTATTYASISDDNVTYSNWMPFMVSDFSCRYAKFKLVLASNNPTHNIDIQELSVSAKVPV